MFIRSIGEMSIPVNNNKTSYKNCQTLHCITRRQPKLMNKDPRVKYFPRVNMQNLIKWVLILTLCLKSKLILFYFLKLSCCSSQNRFCFIKGLILYIVQKVWTIEKCCTDTNAVYQKYNFLYTRCMCFIHVQYTKVLSWSNDRLAKTMHPPTNISSNLSY